MVQTNSRIINDIVKEYPNMLKIVIYHEGYRIPLCGSGRTKSELKDKIKADKQSEKELSIQRSVRRSRSMIKDLVLCNDFDLWTTFTFSPKSVNRYDLGACRTKMSCWLSNQRYHSPNLKYLIIPELHKDGALHFHALMSGFNGPLKKLKLKTPRNQDIYKFSGYRSGRSQAVYITKDDNDYEKLSNYITKYITKDMHLIFNRQRYWRSRNLILPKKTINGVNLFNLREIIKNQTPAFINDIYEVQYHKIANTTFNSDNQMILL